MVGFVDKAKQRIIGDEVVRVTDKPVKLEKQEPAPKKPKKKISKKLKKDDAPSEPRVDKEVEGSDVRPEITVIREEPKKPKKKGPLAIESFETWDDEPTTREYRYNSRSDSNENDTENIAPNEEVEKAVTDPNTEPDVNDPFGADSDSDDSWNPFAVNEESAAPADDSEDHGDDTSHNVHAEAPQSTGDEAYSSSDDLSRDEDTTDEFEDDDELESAMQSELDFVDGDVEEVEESPISPSSEVVEDSTSVDESESLDWGEPAPVASEVVEEEVSTPAPVTPPIPEKPVESPRRAKTVETEIISESSFKNAGRSASDLVDEYVEGEPISLDQIAEVSEMRKLDFPLESEGYNRESVRAMIGYGAMSLSLALSRVKQLDSATIALAERLIEVEGELKEIAGSEMVTGEEHQAVLGENRNLKFEVESLRSRLGEETVEEDQDLNFMIS